MNGRTKSGPHSRGARSGRPGKGHFRAHRHPQAGGPAGDRLYLYGVHPVRFALANPRRRKLNLLATRNALARLELDATLPDGLSVRETSPKELDRLLGPDAVHQGVALECLALAARPLGELAESRLLVVLDQVTDPHNVGAVLRSAVAFGAGALITTARHSPVETGVLAKSASGALELIDHVEVRNLADCLEELGSLGYVTIGLDGDAPQPLEEAVTADRIALVLGAEGKGLRQKTRATCSRLARLELPGAIKSLNVSNAAALALYVASRSLSGKP